MGTIWDLYGECMGGLWETYGRSMGEVWKTNGNKFTNGGGSGRDLKNKY